MLVPRLGTQQEQQERGWDWRAGVREDARGEEVMRRLRMGLAGGIVGM